MNTPQFIFHSTPDGHLCRFQVAPIINEAAMNRLGHGFFCLFFLIVISIHFSQGYTWGYRIAGS